jgi:hypothetical protein
VIKDGRLTAFLRPLLYGGSLDSSGIWPSVNRPAGRNALTGVFVMEPAGFLCPLSNLKVMLTAAGKNTQDNRASSGRGSMRISRMTLVLTGVAAAALAGAPASAHHSFAMFDYTKNVTIDGTV